ncbi:MAG: hypothetical protein C4567_13260 [Deltaproteobacteria bacterium]|nr:MAG: hypothetical protein C4567_13260 [Deltaproteobacteria bacterium]
MRLNCLSCGHKVELDNAYDEFEGPVKCLCGTMLEIRTKEGLLKAIKVMDPQTPRPSQPPGMPGAAA